MSRSTGKAGPTARVRHPRFEREPIGTRPKVPGQLRPAPRWSESPAASRGTAIHAFIDTLLSEGVVNTDGMDQETRETCQGIDPAEALGTATGTLDDVLPDPGALLTEVPFAFTPDTGRASVLSRPTRP